MLLVVLNKLATNHRAHGSPLQSRPSGWTYILVLHGAAAVTAAVIVGRLIIGKVAVYFQEQLS